MTKNLNLGFEDKFEVSNLKKSILVPNPNLEPQEFLEAYKEILKNSNNKLRLCFNEKNVHLSDPFWEEAVEGNIRDELVPSILRARKKVKDEERFDYKWKKQWEIKPSQIVEQEEEKTVIAWDIKITPQNEPVIIEFHEYGFGLEGFSTAFQYGSIQEELKEYQERGDFARFLLQHANDKQKSHQVIGEYMPPLVKGEDAGDGGELTGKVVVKPGFGEAGMGIKILTPEKFREIKENGLTIKETPFQDEIVERFVKGKDIVVDGEIYDGCMRYVTALEIKDNRMILTDVGGYWRIAPQPKDSSASNNQKYLANLSSGIRVPASFLELSIASKIALKAVEKLYNTWLRKKQSRNE